MEIGEYKATIYDIVWRTIVHDFPYLLIAFVNELFSESYSKDARVEFLQDTHEQKLPDGTVEKRIMPIELKTPDGSISYKIPVVKMQNYTIDIMFKKRLLILLPFYLFVVEKPLKDCEADSDKLAELLNSLQTIVKGLDALMLLGYIDELTRNSILEFKQYGKCSFSKKLCYGQEGS